MSTVFEVMPLVAAQQPQGSPIVLILYMVIFIGTWYVLVIRPKQIQQKKHAEEISLLKKGANVLLQSGIYGEVHNVESNHIMVKIAEKTIVKVDPRSISTVLKEDAENSKEDKK